MHLKQTGQKCSGHLPVCPLSRSLGSDAPQDNREGAHVQKHACPREAGLLVEGDRILEVERGCAREEARPLWALWEGRLSGQMLKGFGVP